MFSRLLMKLFVLPPMLGSDGEYFAETDTDVGFEDSGYVPRDRAAAPPILGSDGEYVSETYTDVGFEDFGYVLDMTASRYPPTTIFKFKFETIHISNRSFAIVIIELKEGEVKSCEEILEKLNLFCRWKSWISVTFSASRMCELHYLKWPKWYRHSAHPLQSLNPVSPLNRGFPIMSVNPTSTELLNLSDQGWIK